MKNSKKLYKLIALAVLFGGVTLSRPVWAADTYNYFYGNLDYSAKGGIDLSTVTDGIQLQITGTDAATITFNGSSFNPTTWLPGTGSSPAHSRIAAIKVASGKVSNAKTIISDGTITSTTYPILHVYGGFTSSGVAEGNEVNIQGGTISVDHVIGGETETNGDATNNTINIGGGKITDITYLLGGSVFGTNDAINNRISISDGSIVGSSISLRAGDSTKGLAQSNIVEISGGTITEVNSLLGGYSGTKGTGAIDNKVLITGGSITSKIDSDLGIRGGESRISSAENNMVEISGGIITEVQFIIGGRVSDSAEDAINNKVLITGGDIINTDNVLCIYVGQSTKGSVENNVLEIQGGTIINSIFMVGGFADVNGTGNATNNKILITGGDIINTDNVLSIYAGCSYHGTAKNNVLEIQGGTITNSQTLMACYAGGTDANVTNNKILFTGGSINGVQWFEGAFAAAGNATNNNVLISGGSITFEGSGNATHGGYSSDGSAENNTIEITGGALNKVDDMYGGFAGDNGTGNATNNKILITGGTFTPKDSGSIEFYGGYVGNSSGSATGNTVALIGGELHGTITVYGGKTNGGSATNNTVAIGNDVQWVKNVDSNTFNLYGGNGTVNSGNTLILDCKNITATNVGGFENYVFYISTSIDSSTPMLNNINAITLVATDTIKVTADQTTPVTVILANNVEGAVSGSVTYDLSTGNNITGGEVSIDESKLVYTKGSIDQWINVQPSGLSGNIVVVDGSKDGSNNPLATVNGGTQTFVAGDSGKTEWQNVYGGYSSVQGVVVMNNAVTISGTAIVEGNVYGGFNLSGLADGNKVEISGGALSNVIGVYGAKANGNATNNKTYISGGVLNSVSQKEGIEIYGGNTTTGLADGNKVEISGGTLSTVDIIYGAYASTNVTNNQVLISGEAEITGFAPKYYTTSGMVICGGYAADNGYADGNMVEISGGTLSVINCFEGARANGDATNNQVLISKGTIDGNYCIIRGANSDGSSAEGNMVEISGGALSKVLDVYGAEASGNARNNKIYISGDAEITGLSNDGMRIRGGYANYGSVESNMVEVSGGTLSSVKVIYGASASKDGKNNKVVISKGEITGVSSGMNIRGGNVSYDYTTGTGFADGNLVEISDGMLENVAVVDGAWGGGYKNGVNVTNNEVRISGGEITGLSNDGLQIRGGITAKGSAEGNMVEIKGGMLSNVSSVYGGNASTVAQNNLVLINGQAKLEAFYDSSSKTNSMKVYGGFSTGDSIDNTVALLGGTMKNVVYVYGGWGNLTTGTVTNNTVEISDKVDLSDAKVHLYGGKGKTCSNNTLVVDGKNITVTSVNNFDTYLFCIPTGIDSSTAMLKNTARNTLSATDTIKVTADQSTPDTVILSDNFKGTAPSSVTYDLSTGNNITGGGVSIQNTINLVYSKGTVSQWINVQPTTITGNTVAVDGSKDGSDNPLATVNGGTQTFVAGTSGKTKWQNVYGGYSSVQGAAVTNNTVNISGTATIEGNVYGGYLVNGNVIGNTVNIKGGEISGNVYGGKSNNASATVTDNTLNWSAGTVKGSEIRANNINITGTAAQYLGTAGTMTADGNVVLGDGATFTVGDGTDVSALTFGSGLDDKATSVLQIAENSNVIFQGVSTLEGTVTGAGKVVVDGAVTADADKFTQTGGLEVKDNTDVLTLTGTDKTVGQTISGAGKVVIDGTLNADADKFTQTGGLEVKDIGDVLNLTEGKLNKVITNNGTVKLSGATLGGKYVTAGTLEFAADLATDAINVAATTNIVDDDVELALTGGTLGGAVSGTGKVIVDGLVSADADKFTQTGGLEVKDNDDILTLTAGELTKAITNNGKVEMKGAKLGAGVTGGFLDFVSSTSVTDASYVAGAINRVNSGQTLTLQAGTLAGEISGVGSVAITGEVNADADKFTQTGGVQVVGGTLNLTGQDKVLGQKVSGAGKVVIDGTISADAGKFTQTGGLEVQDTLAFTSRGLDVAAVGGFSQVAGSNVTVDAFKIQADSNDPAKAMFTGVDSTDDLKVVSGNLTINGQVTDGQYYVLVAGDAVANEDLTAAYLWNKENITLDTSKYLLADYDYVTNGNAIAVKVQAATVEEVNTSGLAAVQQGALAVSKEFTSEVENHLGFMNKPSLKADKVEVRDVVNEKVTNNVDNVAPEVIETGKVADIMPVQVAVKDRYDKEIWASYIRTKETTEGMKLGAGLEGNNTAQYNGAVVGVDFYSSRKAVTGVAISYTTGDIDSQSNGTFTRNKSKYYGVSFYDRVTNGNTAMIYDIGYIRGDNDISQFYTGQETTADVKTDTYTAGVRYEAEFGTEKSRVVPFASFRYMRQNNKDYTNSHNTRFETKDQNIYIPKVGIAWTGDFSAPNSVCTWRPSVEVGYLWNLGDRSAESNVLVGARMADIGYDIADKSSYYARAGLEFMSKNFTAGVFYRYLKGNAVKNNKWNVNMSWKF